MRLNAIDRMNFLTANWKHLILANYQVDPQILTPFLPQKTTLDTFEGKTWLSLVGFLFDQTRVLGIPFPTLTRFEEVNLRFYVCPQYDTSIRGVSFIQEIVPRPVIPFIANRFFHENYVRYPMTHEHQHPHFSYTWNSGVENKLSLRITSNTKLPEENSIEEFITEHYWGYSKGSKHCTEYQVQHPQWNCCIAQDVEVNVDFKSTYGNAFEFLNHCEPDNVIYARGSQISVSFPRKL